MRFRFIRVLALAAVLAAAFAGIARALDFDVWARRFSIATTTLPSAGAGAPYSATLQTAGIDSNTTWEVTSGSLPAGLTLSPAGVISGTPSAQGSSAFTVKASGVAKDFT